MIAMALATAPKIILLEEIVAGMRFAPPRISLVKLQAIHANQKTKRTLSNILENEKRYQILILTKL